MEALEKRIMTILAARCGKDPGLVAKEIERKEIWMSAEEALEWGLIDSIE